MRLFELILVALLGLYGVFLILNLKTRIVLVSVGVLTLLAATLHALVEGPHWQMIPAYLAMVLIFGSIWVRASLFRKLVGWATLLLVVASSAASAALPMFRLPEPSGQYLIGTRLMHLVQGGHGETLTGGMQAGRELMIQIWYPALPSNAPKAEYRSWAETTSLSTYQSVLWTHAKWDAPVAGGRQHLPILLLNPAWNGRRTNYTYLAEELASHGYVVVGIDHSGNSGPTLFPDGRVEQPIPSPEMDFDKNSLEEVVAFAGKEVVRETADDRFVLDELSRMNQDAASSWYGHLDTNRVGTLGHSVGGSVSAEACLEDSRILSAMDMDGALWGPVQQTGLAKPFLMIEEDPDEYTAEALAASNFARVNEGTERRDDAMMSRSNGYRIFLHGSSHDSFTDRSLFSPLRRFSGAGKIPAVREYAIIRAYALAFFDKTLRGQDSAILRDGANVDPEVELQVLPGANPARD